MHNIQRQNFWLTVILMVAFLPMHGQTDIKEGGHVVIASGATLTTKVNVIIGAGGNLVNDGMMCIGQDLINQNPGTDNLGSGIFNFCGEVGQAIFGDNILGSLIMNNPAGLSLGGSTQILGQLTLANGRIILGIYNLTLGMQSMVGGNPSAASMVVATSSGELRKSFAGPGVFTFPVGDANQAADYSPVTISVEGSNGSFAAGNYIGVTVVNMVYPDPNISGTYLRRYWNLSHSGLAGFSSTASFRYVDSDVEGDEATLACIRVNPLPWSIFEPANITDNILVATGISFFTAPGGVGLSSFTGMSSPIVPATLQLSNVVITPGTQNCYAATQVLTVAGSGSTFMVLGGGSVDLTAGQVISFQPLAVVTNGGNLHAWISPGGPFCGTLPNRLVSTSVSGDAPVTVPVLPGETFLLIYPNPTTDQVIIEFRPAESTSSMIVDIFSMNGLHMYMRSCHGEAKIEVSMAGWPAGIFMVCARSGNRSGITKLVKL